MHRSLNPDLLFSDVIRRRAEEVAIFWRCRRGELPDTFDRYTAFVTRRCNLRCEYCNGPHMPNSGLSFERRREMLSSDLTFDGYRRMLEGVKDFGSAVRHIHFTGGEPMLNQDLPLMVRLATKHGFLSSLTTNGTADVSKYRELIDSGLTEIRISLDSYSEEAFDASVGVKGTFTKALRTIKEVVRWRDEEGKRIFLVINCCVGHNNLEETIAALRFFIGLGPDDVKFLVIAQDKDYVALHRDSSLVRSLWGILDGFPPESFPLLRAKIARLFDGNASGLKDERAQESMRHCFLPLTERTFDGKDYYPCSIYARYGQGLGSISESLPEQQRKVEAFVVDHDCRQDDICRSHCINCCREFNLAANAQLEDVAGVLEGTMVEPREVESVRRVILSIDWRKRVGSPFLIVKPLGMPFKELIWSVLNDGGVTLKTVERIDDWGSFLTTLFYGLGRRPDELEAAIIHSRAAEMVERGAVEIWKFSKGISLEVLCDLKRRIREVVPSRRYLIKSVDERYPDRIFNMTAVHTPTSEEEARRQLAVIEYWKARQF